MPRKLPSRMNGAPKRPKKHASTARYSTSEAFLQNPPIKTYQELEVFIGDIGSKGDGTAIVQGYRIFVPGATVGKRVKIRIVSVGDGFAVAERIA